MSEELKSENVLVNTNRKKTGRPKKEVDFEVLSSSVEVLNTREETKVEEKKESKLESRELSQTEMAELRTKKKAERLSMIRDREILSLSPEQLADLTKKGLVPKLAKLENVNDWKAKGYQILENPEHRSSDSTYAGKSSHGGIEVTDSKSDPTSKSVWMVTDIENRDILREIEIDKSERQMSSIGTGRAVDANGQLVNLSVSGKLTRT